MTEGSLQQDTIPLFRGSAPFSALFRAQRLQLKHCDIEQRMNLCTLKLPAFKGNPRGQTPGIKL